MGIAEDVFIHPSSVLANEAPPEYVVFLETVRTSRVWIKGAASTLQAIIYQEAHDHIRCNVDTPCLALEPGCVTMYIFQTCQDKNWGICCHPTFWS